MTRPSLPHEEWGFNVIGFLTGNFGLAVAARNTLRVLHERGDPLALLSVDPGRGRTEHHDLPGDALSTHPTGYAANLFHVNPCEIRTVGAGDADLLRPVDRINLAVPFWELPLLPVQGWRDVLRAMDLILAPSRFIADAVMASIPAAEVIHYPQAVFLPDGVSPNREMFGLPADSTVFFMSLDVTSDPERKNPLAALRAFAEAFPGRHDVALAVRVNNPQHSRAASEASRDLIGALGADSRVRVFDQPMSYRDVLTLNASSDVYLSLHRSEGLGLNLMEAMSLGRPTIATAWSGNMDFTSEDNSFLVEYDLVPVRATNPAYAPSVIGPGQTWAEPRMASAVKHMVEAVGNPGRAAELGREAKASMERARARFRRGEPFDEVRAIWAERWPAETADSARRLRLARALRDSPYRRLRRMGGRVLRVLGLR